MFGSYKVSGTDITLMGYAYTASNKMYAGGGLTRPLPLYKREDSTEKSTETPSKIPQNGVIVEMGGVEPPSKQSPR